MDFHQELSRYLTYEGNLTTYYQALGQFALHPDHNIKYTITDTFCLNSIAMLQRTRDGRLFYELEIKGHADVIYNIQCTEPIDATYGGMPFNLNDALILKFAAPYSTLTLRIYVDPTRPTITFSYDALIIPNELRDAAQRTPIRFENHIYTNGVYTVRDVTNHKEPGGKPINPMFITRKP